MPFAARRTSTGRDVCGVSGSGGLRCVRRVGRRLAERRAACRLFRHPDVVASRTGLMTMDAVRVIAVPQSNGIISGCNHGAGFEKTGIPWNLPMGERIMMRNVRCRAR